MFTSTSLNHTRAMNMPSVLVSMYATNLPWRWHGEYIFFRITFFFFLWIKNSQLQRFSTWRCRPSVEKTNSGTRSRLRWQSSTCSSSRTPARSNADSWTRRTRTSSGNAALRGFSSSSTTTKSHECFQKGFLFQLFFKSCKNVLLETRTTRPKRGKQGRTALWKHWTRRKGWSSSASGLPRLFYTADPRRALSNKCRFQTVRPSGQGCWDLRRKRTARVWNLFRTVQTRILRPSFRTFRTMNTTWMVISDRKVGDPCKTLGQRTWTPWIQRRAVGTMTSGLGCLEQQPDSSSAWGSRCRCPIPSDFSSWCRFSSSPQPPALCPSRLAIEASLAHPTPRD